MYYYHPLTWKMQWDPPHKTLRCSSCEAEFASVYLDADEKAYCDPCASARVDELLQEDPDKRITYRAVKGGFEGTSETIFSRLKSEPWQFHFAKHVDDDEEKQL